ncbi:MAG: TonB family protein [bacterium]|nr:TonB family protein [bacterium]
MITPEMTLKRALLLSLCLHIALFVMTGPRFQRKTVRYWLSSPVELVSLPVAEPPSVAQPAEQVKPVLKKKKAKEPKKTKEKKAEPKKEAIVIKPKGKAAEPKPEAKTVPQAAPAPVEAAPAKTQLTTAVPDVKDFNYQYYLNSLTKQVKSNWDINQIASHKVVVYFLIERDGTIKDLKIEKSSGVDFYDQLALKAILRCQKFLPLPEGYQEKELNIHFHFNHIMKED